MAIFISYSHADKEFVDRLCIQLVRARAPIWLDRWELNVGDSLLQRIQTAIQGAGALLVILSRSSVDSEWCKKELTAGLVRELEEKKVLVLPVLIEDCDIPLFLKDKLYADFRSDYDPGLAQQLKALGKFINDTRGRLPGPNTTVDWTIDWQVKADTIVFMITMVQQAEDLPYTILLQLEVEGNAVMRDRYIRYAEHGLDWLYRQIVVGLLHDSAMNNDLRLLLKDPQPAVRSVDFRDPGTGMSGEITVVGRILGDDHGSDVLLDIAHDLEAVLESMRAHTKEPTEEERAVMAKLVGEL